MNFDRPSPFAIFRLIVIGFVPSLVVIWFVAAVHIERRAEHPYDAATEVVVQPRALSDEPRQPEYFCFGNVDWVACEVLRPYPTRVCTSKLIHQMTHVVICERNIAASPDGWWGGDGTMVRRVER